MDNSESHIELSNESLTNNKSFKNKINKSDNHKEDKYVELDKDDSCITVINDKPIKSTEYTISHYMGNTKQYFFKQNSPRIVIGPHCKIKTK